MRPRQKAPTTMFFGLLLLLIQAIWTGSYVAMKYAMIEMPVGLILILRYGIATAGFLLFGCFRRFPKFSVRTWALILFVGITNFSLSPYCQLKSLALTQVIDVSALVAMEPILTALMAALLLREKLHWDLMVVFVVASIGVLVLSGFAWGGVTPGSFTATRLLGNLLFIFALCFEAIYSTAGRKLTQSYEPLTIAAWMHLAGFLANLGTNWRTLEQLSVPSFTSRAWQGVLYLGLLCSFVGYGAWYLLVKKVQVSRLALSLFLQPVIGILLGYFLMGEQLDKKTLFGAALIVSPLFFWVVRHLSIQRIGPTQ